MEHINIFTLGFLATLAGAIPLGLVNLSVADVANRKGWKPALGIIMGATIVEVIYGIIAIAAGLKIALLLDEKRYLTILIYAVIGITGLFFLLNRKHIEVRQNNRAGNFIQGILLNIISIQVFLFWLMAVAYINTRGVDLSVLSTQAVFIAGIFVSKIFVLTIYGFLGRVILTHVQIVAQNVNRIIGSVLLIGLLIHILNISFI